MTTSQAECFDPKKKGDTGFKNNLQRPRKTSEGPPSLKHFLPPLAHERRLLFVAALVVGWRVVGLSCAYLMPTLLLLPAPMSNSGKPTSRVSHCVLDVIPTRSKSSRVYFNVTSIEEVTREIPQESVCFLELGKFQIMLWLSWTSVS